MKAIQWTLNQVIPTLASKNGNHPKKAVSWVSELPTFWSGRSKNLQWHLEEVIMENQSIKGTTMEVIQKLPWLGESSYKRGKKYHALEIQQLENSNEEKIQDKWAKSTLMNLPNTDLVNQQPLIKESFQGNTSRDLGREDKKGKCIVDAEEEESDEETDS